MTPPAPTAPSNIHHAVELAHISDLHVPVALGPEPKRRFLNKRLFGTLNLLLKRSHPRRIMEAAVADLRARPPDHLCVTGDLSNLALERELEAARDLLLQIGLPAERVSVIPGNHDAYVRDTYQARSFETILSPLLGGEPSWPRVQRRDDLLVVGINSGLPTPWLMAFGRIGARQFEAVEAALKEHGDAGTKLVLVHHPPVQRDGKPDHWFRRNRDWKQLLETCQQAGATAVLCGHTHRAFRHNRDGLWVLCAGSTTTAIKELGQGATYNRYRIEEGAIREVEVRGYDPAQDAFVHLRREPL
jgi:3',5'-cyclic AMP phosphodiesterase CpdA